MISSKAKISFRQWFICEDYKDKLIETRGDGRFPETVFAYLSFVLNIPEKKLAEMEWSRVFDLLGTALSSSPKIEIPIVKDAPSGRKPVSWDYPERGFNRYINILAGKYGWSIEYISELEVSQAFALIQEILTDEFLEQEFYYSLSDVAYPYNKSTKKSTYKPMDKPYWMRAASAEKPKRIKIRRDTLPVGRVVDVSGLPPEFQITGYVTEKLEKPERIK